MTPRAPKRRAPSRERVNTATLILRLPPQLKHDFNNAAWSKGLHATDVLRGLMTQYVEENS